MPFNSDVKEYINNYCKNHLPDDTWLENEFNFIKDINLKKRIIIEFKNVRYLYKMFEGLNVTEELLLAEVRLQILMYASIYETIIHYVIFDEYYKNEKIVKEVLTQNVMKEYNIPPYNLNCLSRILRHDQKDIIPCFRTTQKRDITKIRFEEKCEIAKKLGLLNNINLDVPKTNKDIGEKTSIINLAEELIKIYEIRNGIHIHAELKKEIEYELEMSKLAYKRMQLVIEQIKSKLKLDNKI